jgi:DNA-binding transcriptional regulator GbsR (MarR family)
MARVAEAQLAGIIEELSLLFEKSGMPRIAGRIVGWLLVCDPPYLSIDELRKLTGASKASVSTMTRLLMHMQLVERASAPGRRQMLFQIQPGAWSRSEEAQIALIRSFSDIAARLDGALAGASRERRARVLDMRENYRFWERELPRLVAKLRRKEGRK